jgi:hypothetical protein
MLLLVVLLLLIICCNCYGLLCLFYVKLTVPTLLSTARMSATQRIDNDFIRQSGPAVQSGSAFLRVALVTRGFSEELRPGGLSKLQCMTGT